MKSPFTKVIMIPLKKVSCWLGMSLWKIYTQSLLCKLCIEMIPYSIITATILPVLCKSYVDKCTDCISLIIWYKGFRTHSVREKHVEQLAIGAFSPIIVYLM